jgi:hypothetical protein
MAELRAGCQAMIIGGFYRTNDGKSVLVVVVRAEWLSVHLEWRGIRRTSADG